MISASTMEAPRSATPAATGPAMTSSCIRALTSGTLWYDRRCVNAVKGDRAVIGGRLLRGRKYIRPPNIAKKLSARGCNGTAAVLIWDSGGNTRRLANASCIDWICRPGRGLDSRHFAEQRAALARPRHLVYPPAEWRRVGLLLLLARAVPCDGELRCHHLRPQPGTRV